MGWDWWARSHSIYMQSAQQLHKHSVTLFSQLNGTDTYDQVKGLLFSWRDNAKNAPTAITTFLRILQLVATNNPELLEDLNRCLLKDFLPSDAAPSLAKIRRLAIDNPNSTAILDSVLTWLRTQVPPSGAVKAPQIEQLSEGEFAGRLERHERCRQIGKLIYLYRRCVITVSEFKKLLEPIYLTDPSFFNMLFQYAQELEVKRRKVTIFAPLNELVDQKYPLEQVGNSYIRIPDGYANWGHSWGRNALEGTLNRSCVSVPLGTEGSFVITRKNEYEEQLLRNEEEKYEIDSNLLSLKAAIRLIENNKRITHPLVQKILSNIYPTDVLTVMLKNPSAELTRAIVLPRLRQKLGELGRCRAKFERVCEEVAGKNFYKSLDYRCFYFCKNDKKFNCPVRWEKEIELRKREVQQELIAQHSPLQIEDRESLQHSRYYVLNSFDNITTQQLLPERKLPLGDPRPHAPYPRFPHNQVLFLLDFTDAALLNDVLQILLYHTQKKSLLELFVFKMLRLSIERRLQRDSAVLQFIEGRPCEGEGTGELLNENRGARRIYKDVTDEFLELIEEEVEAVQVEQIQFPFEGPSLNTFIGTKQCYFFLRYLVTLYQRFARAKTLSQERAKSMSEERGRGSEQRGRGSEERGRGSEERGKADEPSLYSQFLAVLTHKIKEQKGLQEYLRRIFQQDAFIFFTMDKLILGLVKLINNLSPDSLTYKLLKDGVRDYDNDIRKWENFPHPSLTQQLSRLYKETEMLFRFTFTPADRLLYVSAWENGPAQDADKKKKDSNELSMEKNLWPFLNKPTPAHQAHPQRVMQQMKNEYLQHEYGYMVMVGEETWIGKRSSEYKVSEWEREMSRVKRVKYI